MQFHFLFYPISTISKARDELLTKFQSLELSTGKWQPYQTLRTIPFPVYTIPFLVLRCNPISAISKARKELLTKFQSLESSPWKWQPYQTLRTIPFPVLCGNPISAISKARKEILTKFESLESTTGKWQPYQTFHFLFIQFHFLFQVVTLFLQYLKLEKSY